MAMEKENHFWLVYGLGGESLLVVPRGAPIDPDLDRLSPFYVAGLLDRWLIEPENRAALVDIYGALFRPLGLVAFDDELLAQVVAPALRGAFEREELLVLVERREGASRPVVVVPPKKEVPPKVPPIRPRKTFVEIALVDAEERPMPNVAFVVVTPDGQRVQGRLDQNGRARVDDIDPGTCDVEFPDLDGREWGPRPFSGPAPRG